MATKAPNEDNGGEGQSSFNTEQSEDWADDEVVLLTESNISSEGRQQHKQRQEKSKPHVLMINKSCCQTVVSSGASGHVQHVSVVGHVQQLGQLADGTNNILGTETDELPSKKKEKSTSFKITNVYLSRPPSNDGDDSGDDNEDLEDSHTEDLSDIIENLSSLALKDCGSSNTNGPQVLINTERHKPTAQSSCDDSEIQSRKPSNVSIHRKQSVDKGWESSLPSYPHPGFGFVTYHQTGNTFHPVSYLDKTVSGAVAVFNSMECSGELSSNSQPVVVGPQDFKTRFKVVKVETTEPLRRGRWTCIDFTDKHSTPEVSKPASAASNTTSVSKPATKTSEIPPSRPDSALPRDTADPVIGGEGNNTSDHQLSGAKPDLEGGDSYPAPPPGEEKEGVEVRGGSAGPEPGRQGVTPSSGLHISLAQSQHTVPVITATPPVQSPHTANNNLPDLSSIQNSLGQVIRLNDGTLAQVALAPIPQQQQPIVKIIPTTNQQIVHSQQVVVNAQGHHFLVSQQQQNLSQVPQQSQSQTQQSNRSQIAQQPPQSASPQQPLANTRNQQQHQSLQHPQSVRSQQNVPQQANPVPPGPHQQQNPAAPQNPVGGGGQQQNTSSAVGQQHQTQGVIISTALPMQGVVLPQVTTTAGGGGGGGGVPQPAPTTSVTQQQQHSLTVRSAVVNSVVSSRVVSSAAQQQQQQQQQQSPGSHSLLMSSTIAPTPASQAHLYNIPLGPPLGGLVNTNSLDSAFSAVNSVINLEDGDCLVERLEEMVSNRLAEEHRDGELDESAPGAGQGSIDHRIEQAMDLVKSHLMSAVRSEVEELRDKISKLEDTVNHLSRENEVLRGNINPDVLTSLLGNRSILGGIPPDPSAHPALPPPNQH